MERQDSQKALVKAWLLGGRPITPIMALQMYDCFRLSAVIYRLKYEDGMNIETEMVYKDGGKRFAKYYLKENGK
jgi:hypothetical protein